MSLTTVWGEQLDQNKPLPEYPRMQMKRNSYTNLNGLWEYQITSRKDEPDPDQWKQIVVPFALGTKLSGTKEILKPNQALWYRKQFSYTPSVMRTFLNFEAVDQICTVYLNGQEVATHEGGYTPFGLDVSHLISYQNVLVVRCVDESDQGIRASGKQKLEHGGMWYTPSSGIWQTVWLEDLGKEAIMDLKITPLYDAEKVQFDLAGDFTKAEIVISANGRAVHQGVTRGKQYIADLPEFRAWSTDDPFLYDVTIHTADDTIFSYFGMRKFSTGRDAAGMMRFMLNDQPLFLSGLLDQGYVPDGRMTYPADEAIRYELSTIRNMGFNMLRKHAKIECRRWYYHCDKMGILVMQDMPSGGFGEYNRHIMGELPTVGLRRLKDTGHPRFGKVSQKAREVYFEELDQMLDDLYNCPCIFSWCPFNEGWGQFESENVTKYIRAYDETRLIDSASGWFDQGCGDFLSLHNYFFPYRAKPDPKGRVVLLSEFGGFSYLDEHHSEAKQLYGYRKYKNRVELDQAVNELYETMIWKNIRRGLSGCIYTQVSDIEDECNGIFTYDRKVIKLNERRMRRMNERCMRRIMK